MRSLAIATTIWLAAVAAVPAESPTLTDLSVTRDGDVYLVSARLVHGLNDEMLEEIDAGLETSIVHRLQVERQRPGLPNPVVLKRRIECTVQYDALSRQYTLTRRIDGDLQETKVTPDRQAMRSFMTVLKRLPLANVEDLEPEGNYYLKARSDLGLIWRFYLIPWRERTPWAEVPITAREKDEDDASTP